MLGCSQYSPETSLRVMSFPRSEYYYSPLSSEPGRIRLLRLLPHENDNAGMHCELFEYALNDLGKGNYVYEALSYTWGGSDKPRSISINKQNLAVTKNLHTALLCLRDRSSNAFYG